MIWVSGVSKNNVHRFPCCVLDGSRVSHSVQRVKKMSLPINKKLGNCEHVQIQVLCVFDSNFVLGGFPSSTSESLRKCKSKTF